MFAKPNMKGLMDSNENRINDWFGILLDNRIADSKKLEILTGDSKKINGLSIGAITLIMYLLNKSRKSVWFKAQHNGLSRFYPELGAYRANGSGYEIFNRMAKRFAKEFGFEDTELDWVFTTGVKL
jgi:hypothetical protein